MDQSARYSNLDLKEADLIKGEKHILVAYKMKPKAGHGYLEAAAHFAAESSTGTNVEVSTTDDFTKGVDALVYYIDEATEDMRIAYPMELFDRNVTDGRMMLVSVLTLIIGNNQGMGDIEHAKIHDFYVPERAIQLFDGPAKDISDMWRILGRPIVNGGYISGTIIKPKLGLRPEPFAAAAYQFWLGGDFIKNDEPQGNQTFCPLKKVLPLVRDALVRAQDETGQAKLFSMNITADDHYEMCARADFALETFGPDADKVAFLVDGFVGGPGMVTTARRQYPRPVPALPPRRSRHDHFTICKTRLHSLCTGEDVPSARCFRYPRGYHGLRQDGRRNFRQEHRLHDRARRSARSSLLPEMVRHEANNTDHLRRHERAASARLLREPRPRQRDQHLRWRFLRPHRQPGSWCDLSASVIRVLESRADPIEYAKSHKEFARAFESFPGDADKILPRLASETGRSQVSRILFRL